jgi:hypothetical protein
MAGRAQPTTASSKVTRRVELADDRQRSGQRVYDLNTDGVAHYGLFADLVGDMQRQRSTRSALSPLFHSAEGYLRMWQRVVAHR